MTLSDRETVLDAARKWFKHCAGSPKFTKEARQLSRDWERKVEAELTEFQSELARIVKHAGVGE